MKTNPLVPGYYKIGDLKAYWNGQSCLGSKGIPDSWKWTVQDFDWEEMPEEDDRRVLHSFPEAKLLEIKKDCIVGRHSHKIKTELFVLCKGSAILYIQGKSATSMNIGEIYTVSPGEHHMFEIKAGSVLIGLNSMPFDPQDDYK